MIRGERTVMDVGRRLDEADGRPVPRLRDTAPPRALLSQAVILARRGAATGDRAAIDRAAKLVAAATAARPHWGEAWAVAAFVATLRGGGDAGAALARSYTDAPYLYTAGAWRVRYGLLAWDRLSPALRRRVVEEGAWLMKLDRANLDSLLATARQSPGYVPLLLRWRQLRAADTGDTRQRVAP